MGYGGLPVEIVFRKRHRSKGRIVVLCDVSSSVWNASRFMLHLIYSLIYNIGNSLHMLQRTEYQIFKADCYKFVDLKRDKNGQDRIIDVLGDNDTDPVKVYYDSALDFCNKSMIEIQKMSLSR